MFQKEYIQRRVLEAELHLLDAARITALGISRRRQKAKDRIKSLMECNAPPEILMLVRNASSKINGDIQTALREVRAMEAIIALGKERQSVWLPVKAFAQLSEYWDRCDPDGIRIVILQLIEAVTNNILHEEVEFQGCDLGETPESDPELSTTKRLLMEMARIQKEVVREIAALVC